MFYVSLRYSPKIFIFLYILYNEKVKLLKGAFINRFAKLMKAFRKMMNQNMQLSGKELKCCKAQVLFHHFGQNPQKEKKKKKKKVQLDKLVNW